MSEKHTFRLAIAGSWLFSGMAFVVSFWEEDTLPTSLLEYLEAWYSAPLSPVILLVGMALFLVLVAASIGLMAFARWSRPVFLWATIASFCLWPAIGPNVEGPWEALLGDFSVLGFGIVIGLAYCGKYKDHFGGR
jgi:hypothetical protein